MPNAFKETYLSARPQFESETAKNIGAITATNPLEPYVPLSGGNVLGVLPNPFGVMGAGAPRGERYLSPEELTMSLFSIGDVQQVLPKNVFEKVLPYLQRMEERGTLKGTGVFREAPIPYVRERAKSPTATAVTEFPRMDVFIGKELGEKSKVRNVIHELEHIDIRDVTKPEMKEMLDFADTIGMKVSNASYIRKNWNPKEYAKNKSAANAEELFVTAMEDLSPGEIRLLLKERTKKEPFSPSISTPSYASAKGKFMQGKVPTVEGLRFEGMQQMPGGLPPEYVFTLTEKGKESTFQTTDLSKKNLIANRDRISKKFDEVKKTKVAEPKAGDFVSFTDVSGKMQRGKVRDYDPYSKQVEIFPEDQSLVQDPNRASIAVSVDSLITTKAKSALTGKEAMIPAVEGSERLRAIETSSYSKETEKLEAIQERFGSNLEKRGIKAEDFFLATAGMKTNEKMRLLGDLVGKKEAVRLFKEAGIE